MKPVVILDFHEKLNLNYDVILMMCFPWMAKIFYDNMQYDHTKFGIDMISLSQVTGVFCALEIPRSASLNFYGNFSAWINANKVFVLAKLGKIILRWPDWVFLICDQD